MSDDAETVIKLSAHIEFMRTDIRRTEIKLKDKKRRLAECEQQLDAVIKRCRAGSVDLCPEHAPPMGARR